MIEKDFPINDLDTPIHSPLPERSVVRRPLSLSVIMLACLLMLATW
jgi:hypothetical protein